MNGIAQLLLTKKFDYFRVLLDCLKTCKYEKFVDFLENSVPENEVKALVKRQDAKGRNLLHTLVRHPPKKDILERAIEIFKMLVDDYGLDIT